MASAGRDQAGALHNPNVLPGRAGPYARTMALAVAARRADAQCHGAEAAGMTRWHWAALILGTMFNCALVALTLAYASQMTAFNFAAALAVAWCCVSSGVCLWGAWRMWRA